MSRFFSSLIRRFAAARDGGVVIMFALALPAASVATLGGIEYATVVADSAKLQGIADAAALTAAKQLAVDTSNATAVRAQSLVEAQLGALIGKWSLNVTAEVVNKGTAVQVNITGARPSMFGNLLPPGGWKLGVSSEAQIEGLMPLCVLATGSTAGGLLGLVGGTSNVIDMQNLSRVTATGCMIHSNMNIAAENGAAISAGAIEAVGDATGSIAPSPQTGAPAIADPFSAVYVNLPSLCTTISLDILSGTTTLPPGVHCGIITVKANATLQLQPGEHYFFAATLTMQDNAKLVGTDVALVFDATSVFTFKDSSDIELEGRTSGALAGFVIATAHGNTKTFTISTTSAHKLLGVVYIPDGLLSITGDNRVAEASAWTVIVAKGIQISGSANLTVNSNYAMTTVPVPTGVGNSAANATVSLVK
ncbi:MAG TPA: hypothetical protein VGU69_15915 [Rhizomicrobium sp.]|nr:hypothetical protein [Rhizomicrobium sp.]